MKTEFFRAQLPRVQRGASHSSAKLDDAKVVEAKLRVMRGESCAAIARSFGVTRQAVWRAVRGYTWKHLR